MAQICVNRTAGCLCCLHSSAFSTAKAQNNVTWMCPHEQPWASHSVSIVVQQIMPVAYPLTVLMLETGCFHK